ncbi:hypothetical protein ABH994_001548 [Bradyrhizobium yuanmingense]
MVRSQRKTIGRERREWNLRRLAAHELGDQTAGAGRADQADMAVAESIDDVARGARIADAGTSVRHARAMAEPGLDARGRNVLRQFREHADEVVAQDLGALPVRRGLEAGDLDRAGGTQALVGPVHHQLGVGGHHRAARTCFRILDHDMIAALGLEREGIADRCGELFRAGAGRDHRGITSNLAGLGDDSHEPAALELQPGRLGAYVLRAAGDRMIGKGCNISAGIAAAPGLLHHDAEGVARIQIRLTLAHLVGIELQPFDADLPAQAPAEIIVEIAARGEHVHHAVALDQLGDAGFFRERPVQQRRVLQEIAQRERRGLDPRRGPARQQILDQPGQRLRQVRPADRERAERVQEIARHLPPDAGLGRRDHRMRRQPPGIAVARRLFAAGLARIDQRDAVPLAQRLDRADHADRAGSDDGDVAAVRHRFKPSLRA